jgi:hypothetical protein
VLIGVVVGDDLGLAVPDAVDDADEPDAVAHAGWVPTVLVLLAAMWAASDVFRCEGTKQAEPADDDYRDEASQEEGRIES